MLGTIVSRLCFIVKRGILKLMYYLDPHIHMFSRITGNYGRMAPAGCVVVSDPAFGVNF